MKGVYIEKNMFTSVDWSDPIILYDYYIIFHRVFQSRVVYDREQKKLFSNSCQTKVYFFSIPTTLMSERDAQCNLLSI